MSRNILNQCQVAGRLAPVLAHLDHRPADRDWLARKAERWILRKLEPVGRVTRVTPAPGRAWIRASWGKGRATTHRLALPDWYDPRAAVAVHWLDLNGPAAKRLFHDLALLAEALRAELPFLSADGRRRMDLPHILERVRQWAELQRLERDTLIRFPDGFRVVPLTTREDYAYEGNRMGHCVETYWDDPEAGSEILSLRAPNNAPYVTLEVYRGTKVWQIQGRFNRPLPKRFRPHIEQLIKALDLVADQQVLWRGFQYRGFDANDPRSWINSPPNMRDREDWTRFMVDLESAIDSLPGSVLIDCLDRLRHADGTFIGWRELERFDVFGLPVPVLKPLFPWRLHDILIKAGDQGCRRLARALRFHLDDVLHGVLNRKLPALFDTADIDDMITLDLTHHRHHHHMALRQRMARQRRQRSNAISSTASQIWTRNHASVLDKMERMPDRYL